MTPDLKVIRARRAVVALLLTAGGLLLPACGGGSAANLGAFCLQFRKQPPAPPSDASTRDAVKQAEREVSKLQDVAPSEIRGELKTLKSSLQRYGEALEKADPKNPEAVVQAASVIAGDGPKLAAANAKITEFAKSECGASGPAPTAAP